MQKSISEEKAEARVDQSASKFTATTKAQLSQESSFDFRNEDSDSEEIESAPIQRRNSVGSDDFGEDDVLKGD